MLLEVVVYGREALAAEELGGGQRRRVSRLNDAVVGLRYALGLLLCEAAPEDVHEALALRQHVDDRVGELLPPKVLVRVGLWCLQSAPGIVCLSFKEIGCDTQHYATRRDVHRVRAR